MFNPPASLTVKNASAVFETGLAALASGQVEIDFSTVTTVDSTAVATMLGWRRQASVLGKTLAFINIPANLQTLAELYGVSDLLHFTANARADLPHH